MLIVIAIHWRSSNPHLLGMWQSDITSSKPLLVSNIISHHTVRNNQWHKSEKTASDMTNCILQSSLPYIKNYKTATGTTVSINHVLATAWIASQEDRLMMLTISDGDALICISPCKWYNQNTMKVICLIWDEMAKSTSSLAYEGTIALLASVAYMQSNRSH